jgi:WD40 repeat protein
MSDTVVAVYSDMSVGTYKWGPSRSIKHPFMIRMEKHKPMTRRELSTSRSAITRGSAAPQSMENSSSRHSVGNWSFCLTLGGEAKEVLRRKTQIQSSRLASSARDVLSTAEQKSLLVSCGYWDDTVKVHAVDGLKLQCSSNGGHRGPIRCLALGDDGALMVTGGQDATCRVWVVDHPDMAAALSDGYVKTALGENTDGEQILACCHVLWGHVAPVTCLAISSDLDVVVSGSLNGELCVHSIRRGKFVRSMKPPMEEPVAARKLVLDSSGTLVAHMEDCWLHAMTVNGAHLCSVDAGEKLHDMKLTSNGEMLITGGDRCQVAIRAVRDLEVRSILDLSRHGPIRCVTLTPVDLNPIPQYLFVGSDDGMITVVDEDPLSNDSDVITFD